MCYYHLIKYCSIVFYLISYIYGNFYAFRLLLAAYSVIGNDSVQTLGTYISSNKNIKWYYLWAFTSIILVFTITYSWYIWNWDIAHGRLAKIPFEGIEWYHALVPLVLVILTRKGVPVSTSLLILSAFASSLVFEKILLKSAIGYGLAAVFAYILWIIISRWDSKQIPINSKNEIRWRVFQWFATGFLWYTWLSHDIANIAVFLPRSLDIPMLLFVLLTFVSGLAYIFYNQGGKIQNIVLEKSNTAYVRSATFVDLSFAFILLFFKEYNDIPMSTTWVFVGLLCGRELAIATLQVGKYTLKNVFPIVWKDMLKLLFGLVVSIIIALSIQNIEFIGSWLGSLF